jgi:hypothetical protein
MMQTYRPPRARSCARSVGRLNYLRLCIDRLAGRSEPGDPNVRDRHKARSQTQTDRSNTARAAWAWRSRPCVAHRDRPVFSHLGSYDLICVGSHVDQLNRQLAHVAKHRASSAQAVVADLPA